MANAVPVKYVADEQVETTSTADSCQSPQLQMSEKSGGGRKDRSGNLQEEKKRQQIQTKFRQKELLRKDILKKRASFEKDLRVQIQQELSIELAARTKVERSKQDDVTTTTPGRMTGSAKRKSAPVHLKQRKSQKNSATVNTTPSKPSNKEEQLFCLCRTPYDDTKFYVGCDLCNNWFHGDCVGITEDMSKTLTEFVCTECRHARDTQELYCFCKQSYDETHASKTGQLNSSTECNAENDFDLSLVKTEPEEDSLNCIPQIEDESNKQTSDITVKQEHDVENICENGDEMNLNLSDEEPNSSHELHVYNIHEDFEFISVDSVKLEVEDCLEDQECIKENDSQSINQRIMFKDDIEEEKLEREAVLKVQTPLKTYQRKTPVRKRPPFWDADVVKKIKKVDNALEQCDNGQGSILEQCDNGQGSILEQCDNGQGSILEQCDNGQGSILEQCDNEQGSILEQCDNGQGSILKQCDNGQGSIDIVEKSSKNPLVELIVNDEKNNALVTLEKQFHVCMFCKKLFNNIFKHFVKEHSEQVEVSLFKSLPKKSSLRLWQFFRLKRLGDFQHNIKVLESKYENLIVLQSSVCLLGQYNYDQFFPCPDCTGFVHQSQLYSHYCKCVSKLRRHTPATREIIIEESNKLLSHALLTNTCKSLNWRSNTYNFNDYFIVVKEDPCLLLLRLHMKKNCYLLKIEKGATLREMIERMARLLLCCRHLSNNYQLVMSDILIPKQVKLLILSVITILSSTSNYAEKLELRDYLFSRITTCVFIWRGKCLLDGKLSKADEHLQFYHMFLEIWHQEVDTPNQYIKEICNSQLVSNVTILKESLESTTKNLIKIIKSVKQPHHMYYADLAESTFCMLCLFNPVNFTVVQNLKVSEYAVRPDWRADNMSDYTQKMSSIAYYLAEKRFVVCTTFYGKEYVLLFTKEVKKAIDLLISNQVSNFVFPRLHNPLKPYQTSRFFDNMCIRPGFLNADVITDKKKRQYISFITQISDMSQEEEYWIKECYQTNKNILGHITLQSPLLQVNELSEVFDECKKACIQMKQAIEFKVNYNHGPWDKYIDEIKQKSKDQEHQE